MIHTREEVIERTTDEYQCLDRILASLRDEHWELPLRRSESDDPWTVKDAIAHITYWKADAARFARGELRPPDVRRLPTKIHNRVVYERWRDRSPDDVLAWHREVHEDVLAALKAAPEAWFSGRDRKREWPYDLQGHSASHRVREIERTLAAAPAPAPIDGEADTETA
jgi:hypothetical protein